MTQRFEVPTSASAGKSVDICFKNGDLAGQKVTVLLEDGSTPVKSASVTIELDANGYGCVSWTIPSDWVVHVILNDAGGTSATAVIVLT
jgi:hypothetical protein